MTNKQYIMDLYLKFLEKKYNNKNHIYETIIGITYFFNNDHTNFHWFKNIFYPTFKTYCDIDAIRKEYPIVDDIMKRCEGKI
jgi:hypothetical protein